MFAMLFYAKTAAIEFLMNPEIFGGSIILFKIYYILAAPLVGLLGLGVTYLLFPKKIADLFFGFILILSLGLLLSSLIIPINENVITQSFKGDLGKAFKDAVAAYPITIRIFSILLNSIGGVVLLGGALYSYLRDRKRTYNLLLIIGGLLPMLGGAALGVLGDPNIFFEFELGGAVFLFLGFLYSDKYIKNNSIDRK